MNMTDIRPIKYDLMEEKEDIEYIYDIWEKYEAEESICYAIPLPTEIIRFYDNEIGYDKFSNPNDLEEYKEKLKFYKKVAEYYDSNDFVLDNKFTDVLFCDYKKIVDYYISPEVKRRVHGICKELEESIKEIELTEITEYFGEILANTLRSSDIMMHGAINQYLVILPNVADESIQTVIDRVLEEWKKTQYYERMSIEYETESIE